MQLLFEGLGPAGELHALQLVEGRMIQHRCFSLMIVAGSTEIAVVGGQRGFRRWIQGLLVASFFEDGLDTFVTMGGEDERAGTGRIQLFIAVAFGPPQDPEAGTVTLLRVGSFS